MTQQEYEAVESSLLDAMHKVLAKRIKTCLADPKNEKLPAPYDSGVMAYRMTACIQVFQPASSPAESTGINHGG